MLTLYRKLYSSFDRTTLTALLIVVFDFVKSDRTVPIFQRMLLLASWRKIMEIINLPCKTTTSKGSHLHFHLGRKLTSHSLPC